jgi:hypothetical protein
MKNNIPTKEEIIKVLHGCAKVTQEEDGIKIERMFENEAEAILKLFAKKQFHNIKENDIKPIDPSLGEYTISEGTHNKNVNFPYK